MFMSRDYKSRKPSKPKSNSGPLIMGVLIGYALGLVSAIAVWMYLDGVPSPFVPENTAHLDKNHQRNLVELSLPRPMENEQKVEETKPQFDFYKILPGIEEPVTERTFTQAVEQLPAPPVLTSVDVPKNQPTTPKETQSAEKYYLQVGSFRNTGDAENLKARLALMGVVASVQTADLLEKGVWHRVRVGPFVHKSEVDRVRTTLQNNGIEIHFIKVQNNS